MIVDGNPCCNQSGYKSVANQLSILSLFHVAARLKQVQQNLLGNLGLLQRQCIRQLDENPALFLHGVDTFSSLRLVAFDEPLQRNGVFRVHHRRPVGVVTR